MATQGRRPLAPPLKRVLSPTATEPAHARSRHLTCRRLTWPHGSRQDRRGRAGAPVSRDTRTAPDHAGSPRLEIAGLGRDGPPSRQGPDLRPSDKGQISAVDRIGSARGRSRFSPPVRPRGLSPTAARQRCAATPVLAASGSNASARSFSPSAPTTLRTVSNVGTRSPERDL